jgi:hypothetical protein
MTGETTDSMDDWSRLERDHRDAVAAFVARASALDVDRWTREPSPGKWSPCQVAEHVALAYEAIVRDLGGGPPMRLRLRWWQRALLRRFYLPRILARGRLPTGARAPREIRPGAETPARDQVLARIGAGAGILDEAMGVRREEARVVHPYFGSLRGQEILRFCALHTRHHALQLGADPGAAADVAILAGGLLVPGGGLAAPNRPAGCDNPFDP